ncbi:MAG TPA: NPCBM/NEW2 domain-containing protein, partial [Vicinamibacterales bacterium]|nr:NPCBM/NEW2 domain-containing protein [Vicinamibacterales bacterium]
MKFAIASGLAVALAWFGMILPGRQTPAAALRGDRAPDNGVWLDTLDFASAVAGRAPRPGRSVRNEPMSLGGQSYAHGIGVSSNSELWFDVGKQAVRFDAVVGIDDSRKDGRGSVSFEVWTDGRRAATSGPVRAGDAPRPMSVDLKGVRYLVLLVGDGGDTPREDDANWAGAMVTMTQGATERPEAIAAPADQPPAIASGVPPAPRINGPRVTGATPRRPFLFLVPATGDGPLTFAATGLPDGLSIDAKTGIISGAIARAGRSSVSVTVKGPKGTATRDLTIVAEEGALARTPPMGWNSWNVWAAAVDDAKVRAAADWMVKSGLAAHGFQYINIDDTWEGERTAAGEITSNAKFPDMNALSDYVHARGLKIGLYSSPGPRTCQEKFAGSYQHEAQDAATYAKWGFDYLKYDWCSYGEIAGRSPSLEEMKHPYVIMQRALKDVDRDIVYSLCQYGMGDVWEWGATVDGNLWRTTGDITDTWASMSGIGFNQNGHEAFAAPGHWNDPDMLVVGKVGWGPRVHDTRLTPNEQVTHITLWSLLAAPLLIGADMSNLDQFTIDLLSNDEVIAVDQDPLGKAARRVSRDGWTEVWARPLEDGSTAVGLFNRGPVAA